MAIKKSRSNTLGNLNRLLAEIFMAPKDKIDEAEAKRLKRASPKRKA